MRRNIPLGPCMFILLACLAFGAAHLFTPNSKAINAATDGGYIDIKIVDTTVFGVQARGCGEDDLKRFTIEGVDFRGVKRTFYVCASPFKGGTIRSK